MHRLENVCTFVIRNNNNYICKIMINRINLILRAKNITAKQFAEEIGIQPSGMSHILSGRNNPSLEFVNKVIRRYPEIDANWLLLGKGEMYASGDAMNAGVIPVVEPAQEPNLFSMTEPIPQLDPVPLTMAASISEPEPSSESESEQMPFPDAIPTPAPMVEKKEEPAPIVDNGRRLVKILFFYDDRTFEEYFPH